ncbi:hypothetical protein MRB53_041822 [Persea americana]|nr:hypothetical protein MRB53_041822 [Persea americana]
MTRHVDSRVLPTRSSPWPTVGETRQAQAVQEAARRSKPDPATFAQPFCDFLSQNPTVYHAVATLARDLESAGFKKLSERDSWKIEKGGKYYVERNGSCLTAWEVGSEYEPGNGVAMIAGHVDVGLIDAVV